MENVEPNEGAELVHRVAREWLDETALVPISILALDLEPPVAGWEPALAERGISTIEDDLGRRCVRREDARQLVQERRDCERKSAEAARRRRESLEAQVLPVGVPAIEGGSPYESLLAAEGASYQTPQDEFGRGGRSGSVFQELLDQQLAAGRRQERDKRAKAAKKAKP